jgi:hypothetical protein
VTVNSARVISLVHFFGLVFWLAFEFLRCFVNFGWAVYGCCLDFVWLLVLCCLADAFVGFVFKRVCYLGFVNLLLGSGIDLYSLIEC